MKKEIEKRNLTKEEIEEAEETGERVSGEPEQNLAAIGAGGIAGAAAGATIGTAVGGPLGGALGAAIGGLAGGTAGDAIAGEFDPKIEEVYWKEHYKTRPYYKEGEDYDRYLPAYRFGWECAVRDENINRDFHSCERDLRKEWEAQPSPSRNWDEARQMVKESFERIKGVRVTK
jgi:hypothetical protein